MQENELLNPEEEKENTQDLSVEDIMNMSDEDLDKLEGQFNGSQQTTEDEPEQNPEQQLENVAPDASTGLNGPNVSVDIQSFYEAVTAPFKANNTQVQVTDPKQMVRLMQQGLNYNEKMVSLKPHLRLIKSLEQAGVLDEGNINRAIDILQGKPEAIAQFLREKEINSFELPDVEENPHQWGNHIIPEKQYNITSTMEEIGATESGKATIREVDGWDEQSLDEIVNNPKLLHQLHEQYESGLFGEVSRILQQEKMQGTLPEGISNIEAYNHVATVLINDPNSKFYRPLPQASQNSYFGGAPMQQQVYKPEVVGNNLQQPQQYQVNPNSAKNQAGIPRGNPQQVKRSISDTEIWNMSDEEFEQLERTIKFKV